jgi:hypothetical protein
MAFPAATRDDLQIAGGQTALVDEHLGQLDRAERGLAGRLQHHRATSGNRRRHLVHHQIQREVERGDRADDADRHAQCEPDLALAGGDRVERNHLARQLARLGGGELERADRAFGFDTRGLDRLGRLASDDLGEVVATLGQQRRRPVEDGGSLPQRQWLIAQCRLGAGHSGVDIGGGLRRNFADDAVVVWRTDGDAHGERRYWPHGQAPARRRR